jgi:hypothetical protein
MPGVNQGVVKRLVKGASTSSKPPHDGVLRVIGQYQHQVNSS